MKRKLLIIILAVTALLCCIFGFSACKDKPEENASEGLEFTLLPDKNSYALTGMGTCYDSKVVLNKNINEISIAAFAGCIQLSGLDIPDRASIHDLHPASNSGIF